jgi:hypothetical protein
MPSQLYDNDAVEFICGRNFVYNGEEYTLGEKFPQEKALNLETLVRTRHVIPVVEDWADKPRHWHREIRLKSEVLGKLKSAQGEWLLNKPKTDDLPQSVIEPGAFDPWEETEDNSAAIKEKQQTIINEMKEQDEVPTVPGSGKQEVTYINGKEESEPVEMVGPGLRDSEDLKIEVKQVDEPEHDDYSDALKDAKPDFVDPGPIDIEAVGDTQAGTSSGGWNIPNNPGPSTAEIEEVQAQNEQYDPSDYTVDEVNEYLDGADEDEADRVLAAEQAGKNRKGIVGDE